MPGNERRAPGTGFNVGYQAKTPVKRNKNAPVNHVLALTPDVRGELATNRREDARCRLRGGLDGHSAGTDWSAAGCCVGKGLAI